MKQEADVGPFTAEEGLFPNKWVHKGRNVRRFRMSGGMFQICKKEWQIFDKCWIESGMQDKNLSRQKRDKSVLTCGSVP
jgi:hypothetical protein